MRVVSIEELTGHLATLPGPEPRAVVSGNYAVPLPLLDSLGAALERCRVFALNAERDWPSFPGVVNETPIVGPGVRSDPALDYLPMRVSLVPRLFASIRPPDAVLVHTSVPHSGRASLGIEVNILPAAIEQVRKRGGLVVAQLNPNMPHTFGDGQFPTEWIDLAVEVDEPLPSPEDRIATESEVLIGIQVARFAGDGATLQFGIGKIPDGAAHELRSCPRLRIWSELISDGVLALEESGSLDQARHVRVSFLFGSPALDAWADRNPRLRMARTEIINDPFRIVANPAVLSINMAMQVDLFDQVNAAFIGPGSTRDSTDSPTSSPGPSTHAVATRWSPPTPGTTRPKLDGGPLTHHSGDVVPALGHRQRARLRGDLRTLPPRAGRSDPRRCHRSPCP